MAFYHYKEDQNPLYLKVQSIESVMVDDAKMKRLDQLFIDKGYTDKSTSIFKISMIQLPFGAALP